MQGTRRAVLDAIAEGPISGPALARELDVSRAAVWKHVEALREAGFEIGSETSGYTLESVPEYGGPAIEFGLDAPFEIEFHQSLPSTNARARDLAADGESDVVVLADAQTGGRGRLDREWTSPSGGVWLSVLSRPGLPPAHAPLYTLAAAVATTRAVRAAGVDAGIKWPNDVLVHDPEAGSRERKIAGILTEMRGEADRIAWLIVGIGCNANVDPEALPAGATSLREGVGDVSRRELVQRLLREFEALRANPDSILPAWREHALTLGRRVRVETARGESVGRALDITFPGGLVLETADGRVTVSAGDCEHLRPVSR
ncbi:biotin--[acetyl-CoA-carboxylase] ligase [Halobacteriales archaeon QS_3_64_16]|nr:MAG: biotin--[acetyl-CoA-carboxylase] ligase [Halobacteriales archaeon QS_3_64_16]